MKLNRIPIIIIVIISFLILGINFGIDFMAKREYKKFQYELMMSDIQKVVCTGYSENMKFFEAINTELNIDLKNKLLNLISISVYNKAGEPKLYYYELMFFIYSSDNKYSFKFYKDNGSKVIIIQYKNSFTSIFFSVDDINEVVEEIIGFLQ